jgi:hypothetical protein
MSTAARPDDMLSPRRTRAAMEAWGLAAADEGLAVVRGGAMGGAVVGGGVVVSTAEARQSMARMRKARRKKEERGGGMRWGRG